VTATTGTNSAFRDQDDFVRHTERFRRELLAHCYRMLGSLSEAEDLVQETYLNAWRSYATFEGRSSLRTWLYRIATHACLKALERGKHRPLPSDLHAPNLEPANADGHHGESAWLQPLPDVLFVAEPDDPAAVAEARQSTRLALIAALQHLAPRQRAALILRDVLELPAAEAAELLGTTAVAVNSALQRARAQLALRSPAPDQIGELSDPELRSLLDRYAAAFAEADIAMLTKLLAEDAAWEMPPVPGWYRGREAIAAALAPRLAVHVGFRLVPVSANGQPGFATYLPPDGNGVRHAHQIQVIAAGPRGIEHVVAFCEPGLFAAFGLPLTC
jgi:RNA polymerase sigma-70 factor (ECF subfamily)